MKDDEEKGRKTMTSIATLPAHGRIDATITVLKKE
jgi:hypothetical protein